MDVAQVFHNLHIKRPELVCMQKLYSSVLAHLVSGN